MKSRMGRPRRSASLNSSSVTENLPGFRIGHAGIWPYFLPIRQTYADVLRTICSEESMTSASALAESFSIATSVSP